MPPPQYAHLYRDEERRTPRTTTGRLPVGTRIYGQPQPGCFWSSGLEWWRPVEGVVLIRALEPIHGHTGSDWIRSITADIALGDELFLASVAIASAPLAADLAPLKSWHAVRVTRDGPKRPWRATIVSHDGDGAVWHRWAHVLNEAEASA
uniref:Uncharacterized protein n=1 Tax=Streptomyces sp. NBC_00049 TaxID=2903617 RepID=A0AAU2JKY6_9ACTN